jgi:hypothetical protein
MSLSNLFGAARNLFANNGSPGRGSNDFQQTIDAILRDANMEPTERNDEHYSFDITKCQGPVNERRLYVANYKEKFATFVTYSGSKLPVKQAPSTLMAAILMRNHELPFGHWTMSVSERGLCRFSVDYTAPLVSLHRGFFFDVGIALIEEAARFDTQLVAEGLF